MKGKRKGVLLILDGLGDRGIAEFDHKTPLEMAATPTMDRLIQRGQGGQIDPLFPGVPVGTHTGTALLLGVPPHEVVDLPRGPIEAAGIGIASQPGDVLIRCNFATVEAESDHLRIKSRRAGRIKQGTDQLAAQLHDINLGDGIHATLYPATQHRAVLKLSGDGLSAAISDTDPGSRYQGDTILVSEPLDDSKAAKRTAAALSRFSIIAHQRLSKHPLNQERVKEGLLAANGVICRSPGLSRHYTSLINHLKMKAALVAGERTLIGLGQMLGYHCHNLASFTSLSDTNLQGKFDLAKELLADHDLVFIHIKGPDICAHDFDPVGKKELLERIDQALGSLIDDEIVVGITGDHSTDSKTGRHTGDAVPSLLYVPEGRRDGCSTYGEMACMQGGLGRISGTAFLASLLDGMNWMHNFKSADAHFFMPPR
ncbi:MAG: 2,3-bisphosphoglycerate-independent phosphoglycerate mutase [Candidatus Polarisedimenticolaceae bacterium]|nr:2,3-bisphosphoglycerate-independent phosphoglycerate mutase [Candidatus Polarisedimenticolaceae bacterium]